MTSNLKPDAAAFMQAWLARNIAAHPTPHELAAVVTALTHNCLNDAAAAGVSAAEIEMQTGEFAADHIQKAVDKAIGRSPRAARPLPGEQPSPATVIARQPAPAPYRLPTRHS
jgi:hypothetical protein